MSAITAKAVSWTESGLVPDTVIRAGIRRLLEAKRKEIHSGDVEYAADTLNRFVAMMNESPIALVPEIANEQHYEVPAYLARVRSKGVNFLAENLTPLALF